MPERRPIFVLRLNGKVYVGRKLSGIEGFQVDRLDWNPETRERTIGETYTITMQLHPSGPIAECDCGDWSFRREWIDKGGCKHIRALRALRLIP